MSTSSGDAVSREPLPPQRSAQHSAEPGLRCGLACRGSHERGTVSPFETITRVNNGLGSQPFCLTAFVSLNGDGILQGASVDRHRRGSGDRVRDAA
jgi:hypothetical protein